MNIDNLKQFIPDFNIFLFIFCAVFIYEAIIATKNYFSAITEAYEDSDYKAAKLISMMDKLLIVFILSLPFLMGMYLIFYPYSFNVGDNGITIKGYSGDSYAEVPSKILYWDVTAIAEGAFKDNDSLIEVTLPSSVTDIGDYAFANSEKLEKVEYTDNVTYIGYFAFANCKKLADISDPSDKTRVRTGAFCNTIWLYQRDENYVIVGDQHYIYVGDETDVVVPEGVQTVDFYQNETIQSVSLPESISYFQEYCFQGCSSLMNMNLPRDARWESYCFGGCDNLASLNGQDLTLRGSILACDVDRPYEVDEQFRKQYKNSN